eukprot:9555234-Lingulodinium_polyedra.AAC.1
MRVVAIKRTLHGDTLRFNRQNSGLRAQINERQHAPHVPRGFYVGARVECAARVAIHLSVRGARA